MSNSRNPKEIRPCDGGAGSTKNDVLTAHRGMATWGERLVPVGEFRDAVSSAGRRLDEAQRTAAARSFLATSPDGIATEGPFDKIVVFGGVYNNRLALEALVEEVAGRDVDAIYCLGDLGGFGPNPEKVWPLIERAGVRSIQGNYEESLSTGREDCNCGYTDPRDNYYAELSYSYTARNCSAEFKQWMGSLPPRRRVRLGDREFLLVHGSPRRINEFLFSSTSPVPFLEVLLDQEACDGLLCTHSGLHWHRKLPSGRDVVNVGVIGRPANDGKTNVWYAVLEAAAEGVAVELARLRYDHRRLAAEMQQEKLPEVFVDTILTGWWTTCLEILPAKERARSRY